MGTPRSMVDPRGCQRTLLHLAVLKPDMQSQGCQSPGRSGLDGLWILSLGPRTAGGRHPTVCGQAAQSALFGRLSRRVSWIGEAPRPCEGGGAQFLVWEWIVPFERPFLSLWRHHERCGDSCRPWIEATTTACGSCRQ